MSRGDTLATFLLPYKLPSFSGLIFVSRKNISPKGIHPQQYKKNKFTHRKCLVWLFRAYAFWTKAYEATFKQLSNK